MAVGLKLLLDINEHVPRANFFSLVQVTSLPSQTQGDGVETEVCFTETTGDVSGQRPLRYVDRSGDAAILAVGAIDAKPTSGYFTLTFGANTTGSLAFGSTASQMATALNGLASIVSAGGVTVSGADGGPWVIAFVNAGARSTIVGVSITLYPASSVSVRSSAAGAIQRVALKRAPAAQLSSWTPLPSASATVEVLQAGGLGQNASQRITLCPVPYAGTFSLTLGGSTSNPIAYNSTAADLQTILGALTNVSSTGISVAGNDGGPWVTTFIGPKGVTAQPTFGVVASGLSVPIGRKGILDLDTDGIELLLNGDEQVDTTIELELTPSGGKPFTPLHQTITILNDLIENSGGGGGGFGISALAGTATIAMGADFVTVTGLNWPVAPRLVFPFVMKPSGTAINIDAFSRLNSFTTTGFTADLSFPPDTGGYVLGYTAYL